MDGTRGGGGRWAVVVDLAAARRLGRLGRGGRAAETGGAALSRPSWCADRRGSGGSGCGGPPGPNPGALPGNPRRKERPPRQARPHRTWAPRGIRAHATLRRRGCVLPSLRVHLAPTRGTSMAAPTPPVFRTATGLSCCCSSIPGRSTLTSSSANLRAWPRGAGRRKRHQSWCCSGTPCQSSSILF